MGEIHGVEIPGGSRGHESEDVQRRGGCGGSGVVMMMGKATLRLWTMAEYAKYENLRLLSTIATSD